MKKISVKRIAFLILTGAVSVFGLESFEIQNGKILQATLVADTAEITPFACNNDIYLMTANGTSTVNLVNKETAVFTPIGPAGDLNHNGTALNPQDGFIYGVSSGQIIRIGQGMEEQKVGSPLSFAGSYSGAFMADGTYIVNGGTSPLYHVDLNDGAPFIKETVPNGGFNLADIARSPLDGFWYGYDGSKGLVRVNVHTGEYASIGVKDTILSSAGSAFFHNDGTLFLYGSRQTVSGMPAPNGQDALFTANTQTGEVTLVQIGTKVGGSDGASCVAGIDADPNANPNEDQVEGCLYEVGSDVPQTVLLPESQWDDVKDDDPRTREGTCTANETEIKAFCDYDGENIPQTVQLTQNQWDAVKNEAEGDHNGACTAEETSLVTVCDYTGAEFPETKQVISAIWNHTKNEEEGDHDGECSTQELTKIAVCDFTPGEDIPESRQEIEATWRQIKVEAEGDHDGACTNEELRIPVEVEDLESQCDNTDAQLSGALGNGGFEEPIQGSGVTFKHDSQVPYWNTTASDGMMEFWRTGNAHTGEQFVELNANEVSNLYQDIESVPGDVLKWQFAHRGRKGNDTIELSIGGVNEILKPISLFTTGKEEWKVYSGFYTVPEGQTTTRFWWESVKSAGGSNSVGNFLDSVSFETECAVHEDPGEPDPENGEENEGGTDGAETLPIVNACTYANPETKEGGQCTPMFPSEQTPDGQAYLDCIEAGTSKKTCLENWIAEKQLILCTNNTECSTDFEEEEFEVEPVEQGCVKFEDEMYCAHAAEGRCLEIDGQTYCQDSVQRCMVQRISYERTSWGPSHDIVARRNNTQNAFVKLCVYKTPEDGTFGVQLQNPNEFTSYTPTVNVCVPKGEKFVGPGMILPSKRCLTTYPLKGASTYYDRYESCVQQGKTKEECVTSWATGTSQGDLCTTDEDCD